MRLNPRKVFVFQTQIRGGAGCTSGSRMDDRADGPILLQEQLWRSPEKADRWISRWMEASSGGKRLLEEPDK